MNTTDTKNKLIEGLPDIAEKLSKKRSILLIMLATLVIGAFGLHFYAKPKVHAEKSNEEIYSIQANSEAENKSDQLPPQTLQSSSVEEPKKIDEPKQEMSAEQIAFLQDKQKELQQRLAAPLMIVNNTAAAKQVDPELKSAAFENDPNSRFLNQISAQKSEAVSATTIGPLNMIVAEGGQIHATLDSATNTDLPGSIRASVSEPVYSEDGSQVLVPIGSRLIGQYKSGMAQGQERIFIVWSRLITSHGISVNLGALGVDNLGVAGVSADEIDRHFWQRFGTASLLSVLGAGAASLGVTSTDQQNSASSLREAVANSFNQTAGQSLQQEAVIAPTLKTYQGKPIIVFVIKDLHFDTAMQQVKPKINVF